MAVDQRNLPSWLDSDATFRTWAAGIDAQLLAVGMVAVPSAGEINFATVLRPAANVSAGFRIYRFPDSEGHTANPIFLRVHFGVGTTQDRPLLRWQTGSTVDSAGNLGGQLSAGDSRSPNVGQSAARDLPSYCSMGRGGLRLCTNVDASSASYYMGFVLERARGGDNAISDAGHYFYAAHQSSSMSQSIPRVGTVPGTSPAATAVLASQTAGAAITTWGNDVALVPILGVIGRPWIMRGMCVYRHADLSELQAVTAEHMGEQRTFMPLGDGGMWVGLAGWSMAMAWD